MPRRREPVPRRHPPRIPLLLIAGLVMLVALAAFVLWPRPEPEVAADPSAPGRLVATNATVDLGRVPLDVPVEARFALVNTGGQEVRLIGRPTVKTLEGCWPAEPIVGTTVLKPGQQTTLRYQFMMHPGMDGPHRFEIALRTNSPETPIVTLSLRAHAG